MLRLKIVALAVGDKWPTAGVTDDYNDQGRAYLEQWLLDNRLKFQDEDEFNDEYHIYSEPDEYVESPRWCIVVDQEPVVNEWGIESP